jgi:hypothetical protein
MVVSLVTWLLRAIVGLCLIAAAVSKIRHPAEFLAAVDGYELFPHPASMLIVIGIPWVELCVGTALLLGLWLRGAFVLAAALFAAFTFVLLSALLRGLQISCGCFGPASASSIGYLDVGRALLLLSACMTGVALIRPPPSRGRRTTAARPEPPR